MFYNGVSADEMAYFGGPAGLEFGSALQVSTSSGCLYEPRSLRLPFGRGVCVNRFVMRTLQSLRSWGVPSTGPVGKSGPGLWQPEK